MPAWGPPGGPSLQEQQCRPLHRSGLLIPWPSREFTILWAPCGFGSVSHRGSYRPRASPRLGTNTAVLCLPVPASQAPPVGLGCHRVAQSSHKRVVIPVRPAGHDLHGSQEREQAKAPVCALPAASGRCLPRRRRMNHRGGGCLSSGSLCGHPGPHTHPRLPRRREPAGPQASAGLSCPLEGAGGSGEGSVGPGRLGARPSALSLAVPRPHCSPPAPALGRPHLSHLS